MIRAQLEGNYSSDAHYPTAVVNITNHCNLKCAHCFVYRDGNPNQAPESIREEMDPATLVDTVRALRDRHGIQHVLWMGGEPLLRREVLERGIPLFPSSTITTNGTIPLVDYGARVLYVISLDGPEDLNDAIRGEGVYARVIRNLSRIPADLGSPVQAQCTVTRRNQDRLEELVRTLRETRVGWMTFSFYVPRQNDTGADAWPDNVEREAAVREVMRLHRKYPDFVRNTGRSLELMLAENAKRVTDACPAMQNVLPLYLEGDHFRTPFCCYGNDVDCERCGAWIVFHMAARLPDGGPYAPPVGDPL